MGKVIRINESSFHRLFESSEPVNYNKQVSVALYCLENDFLIYNPKVMFGRPIITVNDDDTQRDIVENMMASPIEIDNEKSYLFGGDDVLSEYDVYKFPYKDDFIYALIPKEINDDYTEKVLSSDDIDEKVEWFKENFM